MLFHTLGFFVFFIVVFFLYVRLPLQPQNRMLLIASYIFYGNWSCKFLLLLILSTIVDFFVAQKIYNAPSVHLKRRWLLLSVTVSLGLLGIFKYYNFFAGEFKEFLAHLGIAWNFKTLNVILPIGISFYTFQTMSYTIDIYRGVFIPEKSFVNFALSVAYFPHLVAGPIQRSSSLLTQLTVPREVTWRGIASGGYLFLIGFFKKVAVADVISQFVDKVFLTPKNFMPWDLIGAVYFFAIQIYCDFSGYSDMARGISRMMGIELMVNFKQPYLSENITEFWHNWHISLSTWLRDYLYIPLGGNRKGKWRTYRNLLMTMVLGGLWHGANITFLIWGTLHGFYLMMDKWVRETFLKDRIWPSTMKIAAIFFTFHLVCFNWIFFRSPNIQFAGDYIKQIFSPVANPVSSIEPYYVLTIIFFFILLDLPQRIYKDEQFYFKFNPVLLAGFTTVLITIILLAPEARNVPFIYFQF